MIILTEYDFFNFCLERDVICVYKVLVTQSYPTLCDPVDCSLPGSSVHGILQARVLEWVDISFSKRSSQPRDWTQVSCIAGRFFTTWATGEAPVYMCVYVCVFQKAVLV